jgi:hypothetical protein
MSLLPLRAEARHLGAPSSSPLTQGPCDRGTLHGVPFRGGWKGLDLRIGLNGHAADFSQEAIQVQLVPLWSQVGHLRQQLILNCARYGSHDSM